MSGASLESWLVVHPFLRPLATLQASVERALSEIRVPSAVVPEWEQYRGELAQGVPLLASARPPVSLESAGPLIAALVRRLETEPLLPPLAADVTGLSAALQGDPGLQGRIVAWLGGDEASEPPSPGLVRFLGWTVVARSLRPLVEAFDRWRDEDRWLQRYCPTCGTAPAMAQIAGVEPLRHRLLCCGYCGTRWRYRRTQCPFCENDSQRLSGIKISGEAGLRIDSCDACGGYLKTYDGQGQEALLLADWTSLHLDLLAHQRGLRRQATSLYDVESLLGG